MTPPSRVYWLECPVYDFWGKRAVSETVKLGRLAIDAALKSFVDNEALPGTGIEPPHFWAGVESIIADFMPRNRALLATRAELQAAIDGWWREHKGQAFDVRAHTEFLRRIGYLVPEPQGVNIDTANVDAEIATVAGPQLVVPVQEWLYEFSGQQFRRVVVLRNGRVIRMEQADKPR